MCKHIKSIKTYFKDMIYSPVVDHQNRQFYDRTFDHNFFKSFVEF